MYKNIYENNAYIKNPCFLYMLYWYKKLPEDDKDRAKHVRGIKICVLKYIFNIITYVGFIVSIVY
jgi:hypothetical protein